jgi:hypothetical protein
VTTLPNPLVIIQEVPSIGFTGAVNFVAGCLGINLQLIPVNSVFCPKLGEAKSEMRQQQIVVNTIVRQTSAIKRAPGSTVVLCCS